MDIKGAKALKSRIGERRSDDSGRTSAEIAGDAPPVYHWLGVKPAESVAPQADDDEPAAGATTLFRRLGLSLR
jgi:hypothetical protein